ncbi:pyridoxamine 5'-phosphate oxidase family protein [Tsukamurella paurometabola]|uniref:Pyridoxamine 5'-phosphate oxidase family protein n=1 Tax=Tsukamurella paurometabola TaxID=2061 RepID=A0ABS5NJE3_TSUPA|nr:pyridoxamine 5'-phosphate oxidase family protein [Tsukamurella paurometabola]MBS4104416.1 pyridoxamine 5'-phosphate oxidase family protein [Tsukamurella paurometabola]
MRGPDVARVAARTTVRRAIRTSLHCAIASCNPDGSPHVTPIGSILLDRDARSGIYFDVFNARLARNLARDPRITVLAVDSGSLRWLRALLRGRFEQSPGVQLVGTAGPARPARPEEIARFRRLVGPLGRTPGGRAFWSDLSRVRDLRFDDARPIHLGSMTRERRVSPRRRCPGGTSPTTGSRGGATR